MSILDHWRRNRGGGKGGACAPPLFSVGGKDMFVPPPPLSDPEFRDVPPPYILSRSYAVVDTINEFIAECIASWLSVPMKVILLLAKIEPLGGGGGDAKLLNAYPSFKCMYS